MVKIRGKSFKTQNYRVVLKIHSKSFAHCYARLDLFRTIESLKWYINAVFFVIFYSPIETINIHCTRTYEIVIFFFVLPFRFGCLVPLGWDCVHVSMHLRRMVRPKIIISQGILII